MCAAIWLEGGRQVTNVGVSVWGRRGQTALMLANLLSVCKTIKIIECVVAPPLPSPAILLVNVV